MTTETAAARRERARHQFNVELAECPGHQALALLASKWVTLVVSTLADGPKRYGQLHREVAGATKKMLTQTLRRLERDGLVRRRVEAGVPPEVEYSLTRLGRSILPVQRAIAEWADAHHHEVELARESYGKGLDLDAGVHP
jgi:DNA-binding HxlR family transcriptional regulator